MNELKSAAQIGLVTGDTIKNLKVPVTEKELCELLSAAMKTMPGNHSDAWMADAGDEPLERQQAAVRIRSAMQTGLGIQALQNSSPRRYLPNNWFKDEIDPKYGSLNADFDSLVYVSSATDVRTGMRLMECTQDGYFRYGDRMTVLEAVLAAYRMTGCITGTLKQTAIDTQPPKYVPVDKVGAFNTTIITPDLLAARSTLPDATNQKLPYWTGFNLENKLFLRSGYRYFYEDEIKFLADNGFNCARVLVSLSYLANPNDITQVNESELEQLDQLLSWGLKYNVNIQISISGMPGFRQDGGDTGEENVGGTGGEKMSTDKNLQGIVGKYWQMLARRYAAIPNRNLCFELFAEPQIKDFNLDLYATVCTPMVQGIWKESSNRVIIVQDLAKAIPEKLMALGCCVSVHDCIYTYSRDESEKLHTDYQRTEPILYLPTLQGNGKTSPEIRITRESEPLSGEITIWAQNGACVILADNKQILKDAKDFDNNGFAFTAKIPAGTKELRIKTEKNGILDLLSVIIQQDGYQDVKLASSVLYSGYGWRHQGGYPGTSIQVGKDGKALNCDGTVIDGEYLYKYLYQDFAQAAKKYNVGFMVTEVGTNLPEYSEAQEFSYDRMWIGCLKKNHIPWCFGCLQDVLYRPEQWSNYVKYLDDGRPGMSLYQGMNNEYGAYKGLMDMLKELQ